MDTLLFHPKIVHLPIALAVLLPLLSGGLLLAWWQAWLPQRAWWLAVAAQALLVGTSYLALETGEAEEERVEAVVPEAAIEAHEEAAEAFSWAALAALLPLGLGLLPIDPRLARSGALVGVGATVLVLGLGYRVGEAGGALVYTHNAGAAYAGGAAQQAGGGEGGEGGGWLGLGGGEAEGEEDDD